MTHDVPLTSVSTPQVRVPFCAAARRAALALVAASSLSAGAFPQDSPAPAVHDAPAPPALPDIPLPLFAPDFDEPPAAATDRENDDLAEIKRQRFNDLMKQVEELARRLPRPEDALSPAASPPGNGQREPPPRILPPELSESLGINVPIPFPDSQPLPPGNDRPGSDQPLDGGTIEEEPLGEPSSDDAVESYTSHAPSDKANRTQEDREDGFIKPDVDGPIDRFALAVSLFGARNYPVCLQVLRNVDLSSLSRENRLWSEYMQACCHRQLGEVDEAKRVYRRILASSDADWIGDLARWWLEELEQKSRLQADSARLTEVLKKWEQEVASLSR